MKRKTLPTAWSARDYPCDNQRLAREAGSMIFRAPSRSAMALACVAVLANVRAPADIVWSGLGLNSNWTNGANWEGGSAPVNDGSEQVRFTSSSFSTVVVNTPQSIRRLRFDFTTVGGRVYSLSGLTGATLTLGSDGI